MSERWSPVRRSSRRCCTGARSSGHSRPAAALSLDALTATAHPPLPRDPSRLWLAPLASTRSSPAYASFSRGVRLHGQAQYADALPLVRASLANTPLADYGQYYTALTELRLSRLDEARAGSKRWRLGRRRAMSVMRRGCGWPRSPSCGAICLPQRRCTPSSPTSKGLVPEDVLLKVARTSQAAGDLAGRRVRVDAGLLRVSAERRRGTGAGTARHAQAVAAARAGEPALQAGARSRRTPVRLAPLRAGAVGARAAAASCRGRHRGTRRAPSGGMRFLPQTVRRDARGAGTVDAQGVATRRGAVLLPERDARARAARRVRAALARARRRLAAGVVGRGDAEQPGDALHPGE